MSTANAVNAGNQTADLLASLTSRKATKESDSDRFLTLMIAQLQNQDPTNPTSNGEMMTQLSQMNSMASFQKVSDALAQLVSELSGNNMATAAQWVGKEVSINSSEVSFAGDEVSGSVLTNGANRVSISILDQQGNEVRKIEIDSVGKNTVEFDWDGKDNNGNLVAEGKYKISANSGKNTDSLTTLVSGEVTGALMTSSGVVLSVKGVGEIYPESIVGVKNI